MIGPISMLLWKSSIVSHFNFSYCQYRLIPAKFVFKESRPKFCDSVKIQESIKNNVTIVSAQFYMVF